MTKLARYAAFAFLVLLLALMGCDNKGSGGASDSADIAEQLRQAVDVLDQSLPDGEIDMAHRQVRSGMQNPDAPLLLFPVTENQKENYEKRTGKKWTPLVLLEELEQGPPPKTYEVRQMTEIYAIYIDKEDKYLGKPVVFKWMFGLQNQPFAEPMAVTVRRFKEYPYPIAYSYAWSDPANASRLVRGLGLRSLTSAGSWGESRCYGPRTVRVYDFGEVIRHKGETVRVIPGDNIVAESGIDLLEPGVHVVE